MELPANLLIGNAISLVAAWFTARSSWAKDRWHIYINQMLQCLLLALASVFFRSYAGIVMLLISALRNFLAARDQLNRGVVALCLLALIPGILVNNRGWVGWIVIAAHISYTLGMYFVRREKAIKWNMIVNLSLWALYDGLIWDVPSFFSDSIGLGLAIASLRRKDV